mmetsp:Transcript_61275/g.115514  ORF Transcript_61275/g.115514 Transcript_61275/m.115514 type:complete len:266 (-) Transcript_61275:12-809(-)
MLMAIYAGGHCGCAAASCKTASDLALHTDIMGRLVDDLSLASLRRFERLVVYGNLVNDILCKPCTALILPEGPVFIDPRQMVPLPLDEPQMTGEETLADFTSKYRGEVRELLEKLLTLPWERYAVYFAGQFGEAHVQIINHALEDKQKAGVQLVAHLAGVFAEGAKETEAASGFLRRRSSRILAPSTRALPQSITAKGKSTSSSTRIFLVVLLMAALTGLSWAYSSGAQAQVGGRASKVGLDKRGRQGAGREDGRQVSRWGALLR